MTDAPRVVVDASVVVKWYLLDEDSVEDALAVRLAFERGRIVIVLPDVARYEVAHALLVARQRGRLTDAKVQQAMADFFSWGFAFAGADALILAAVDAARRAGCAFHDACYIALADALGVAFVTADRRLWDRTRAAAPSVVWLGDYQPA